jgi:hypothetical protein
VKEIKAWADSKGIGEYAWAIIKAIRKNGTDEAPFAKPTWYQLNAIAKPYIAQWKREMAGKLSR